MPDRVNHGAIFRQWRGGITDDELQDGVGEFISQQTWWRSDLPLASINTESGLIVVDNKAMPRWRTYEFMTWWEETDV